MKADIDKEGLIHITPMSMTEETMLHIWLKDKKKEPIKEVMRFNAFEEIGPACIKSVTKTAEDVDLLSSDLKKVLRENIKKELDGMKVDYNGRAGTKVLQAILEREKAAANVGPSEKQPGEETPPEPPSKEEPPSTEPPAEDPMAPPAGPAKKELDPGKTPDPVFLDVREGLKEFAAVHGTKKGRELLAKFEVEKVSAIKEEDYPKFLAAIKEASDAG